MFALRQQTIKTAAIKCTRCTGYKPETKQVGASAKSCVVQLALAMFNVVQYRYGETGKGAVTVR